MLKVVFSDPNRGADRSHAGNVQPEAKSGYGCGGNGADEAGSTNGYELGPSLLEAIAERKEFVARIVNKLAMPAEGILCGSLAEAEAKLEEMLNQFRARGFRVSETKDDEGVLHNVLDQDGRPVGIFYIE